MTFPVKKTRIVPRDLSGALVFEVAVGVTSAAHADAVAATLRSTGLYSGAERQGYRARAWRQENAWMWCLPKG